MTAATDLGWMWLDPQWCWLLLLLPVPVLLRRRAGVRLAAAALAQGPSDDTTAPLPRSWRTRLLLLVPVLQLLALGCGVLALARPVFQRQLPPERLSRDVFLCIDRSSSMAAMDLAPGRTRLAVGVEVADGFVGSRPDDRIGVIQFARYPDLRCPPTHDHELLRLSLAGITMVEKDGPEDATGIGTAVTAAAEALQRTPAKGRVIVLLTDGEETVATAASPDEIAPLHAAQLCAGLGIRVHTVVVGPDVASANTKAVQQLATTTGGRFFAARDENALRSVYAQIDALEAVAHAEPAVVGDEWFGALLWAAVLASCAAHLLSRTWLGTVP